MANYYDVEDMSKFSKNLKGSKVAIVQTFFHKELINKMSSVCSELLEEVGIEVDIFVVPGSYEIPLTTKLLAKKAKYDAIVVFGIIRKGDTYHFEMILDNSVRELGKVMHDLETPIIMEILPVTEMQHAIERTEGENNKGIWAAKAAIDTIKLHKFIKAN